MNNDFLFVEDNQQDIHLKAKMYYHLCCGDSTGDDFDESWDKTRLSFYKQEGYVGTMVMKDSEYVGFIVSKDIQGADEYIQHNYGYDLLRQELDEFSEGVNLETINYIDGLFVYVDYRELGLGSQLLQYHESMMKNKGYQYSMLEYDVVEKPYLGKFYTKNGYHTLFDYVWTHRRDTSKTKQKTLLIKKI